jgi:hypothetical protein
MRSRGIDIFNRLLTFITEANCLLDFMKRRRAWLDNINYIMWEKI